MRKNLKNLFSIGLFCLAINVFAQQKPITGQVVDSDGFPVQDAYVYVEGSENGVYTDYDGNYTIEAEPGDNIIIEFIGFENKSVSVGNSNEYNITLTKGDGAIELKEIVAVAYGNQSREELVGSVATVNQDVLDKQQATTVTSALQGSVPGVNIISSGGPGDNPSINIRGVGSINASTEPLIVLDGIPYGGNLNSISQDQIESISVLKDAGSTALYGSRGANGVIIITTKSGRKNMPTKITFTSLFGISDMAQDIYPTLGAKDYMQLTWEALRNTYKADPGYAGKNWGQLASDNLTSYLGYNPFDLDNPIDSKGNVVNGANLLWDTDWANEILRDKALRNDIRLAFEGGGEKTSYFFNIDYLDQEGLIKTSRFTRYSTRLNLKSDLKNWLTTGINTSFTKSQTNYPDQSGGSYSSAMQWIYNVANVYPVYMRDEKGNFILDIKGNKQYDYGTGKRGVLNSHRNIYLNENVPGVLYNSFDKRDRYDINANGFLNFKISERLSNKISLGYQAYIYDNKAFSNAKVGPAKSVSGRAISNRNISSTLNFNNALNYKFNIGNHNFNLDGIFETYSFGYDPLSAQSTGFVTDVFVQSGSTKPERVGGYLNIERMESYLGRVSYNFNKKYFLEGSYRKDGSTKFSKDTRWGNFYSAGASWIVSNEEFFKNEVMNFLKFKVSYGELGNNLGIGYFPYLTGYEAGWPQLKNIGVLLLGIVDPNLTWEKTGSFNLGVDFGLFKNRLSGTIEYYEKNSIDLIYNKPIPMSSGSSTIKTNVGSLSNYGIEVTLQSKNINNDNFKWTSGLNFSIDRNKITNLYVDSYISGTKRWEVGRSLYDFYMPTYAGIDPEDGYVMWYKDVSDSNGKVKREKTKVYDEATREYQNKTSLPDFIGGFSNNFKYKDFDLNFLINFSFGSYVYDGQLAGMQSFESVGRQVSTNALNRWRKPGDKAEYPILTTAKNNFFSRSSKYLFKNDYLRLKAINFGYNLPDEILSQIGINQLRIYLQGDNLFTWQTHKGIDPEQSLSGTTNNRALNMKTFSVGLKLTF